jgi:hypothetical protein
MSSESPISGVEEQSPRDETDHAIGLLRQARAALRTVSNQSVDELDLRAEELDAEIGDSSHQHAIKAGVFAEELERSIRRSEDAGDKIESVIEILEQLEESEQ